MVNNIIPIQRTISSNDEDIIILRFKQQLRFQHYMKLSITNDLIIKNYRYLATYFPREGVKDIW